MDPKPQDNSDLSTQYQAILDQYAKELKSLNNSQSDNQALNENSGQSTSENSQNSKALKTDTADNLVKQPETTPMVSSQKQVEEIPLSLPRPSQVSNPHIQNKEPSGPTTPSSSESISNLQEVKSTTSIFKFFFYFSILTFFCSFRRNYLHFNFD